MKDITDTSASSLIQFFNSFIDLMQFKDGIAAPETDTASLTHRECSCESPGWQEYSCGGIRTAGKVAPWRPCGPFCKQQNLLTLYLFMHCWLPSSRFSSGYPGCTALAFIADSIRLWIRLCSSIQKGHWYIRKMRASFHHSQVRPGHSNLSLPTVVYWPYASGHCRSHNYLWSHNKNQDAQASHVYGVVDSSSPRSPCWLKRIFRKELKVQWERWRRGIGMLMATTILSIAESIVGDCRSIELLSSC